MRSIERASAFKKDFKRVKATPKHAKNIDGLLENVLELLITNQPLPDNNKDHHLTGNWVGYCECHLKPDLLMIYKKTDVLNFKGVLCKQYRPWRQKIILVS